MPGSRVVPGCPLFGSDSFLGQAREWPLSRPGGRGAGGIRQICIVVVAVVMMCEGALCDTVVLASLEFAVRLDSAHAGRRVDETPFRVASEAAVGRREGPGTIPDCCLAERRETPDTMTSSRRVDSETAETF